MPRDPQVLVFVGIKNSVVALDDRTGAEVWRTPLRGSDFVSVVFDGEGLIAANSGEVYRLDPRTGSVLWHNELTGLGRGVVTLASSRGPLATTGVEVAAGKQKRNQDAAAASAAAAS